MLGPFKNAAVGVNTFVIVMLRQGCLDIFKFPISSFHIKIKDNNAC